MKVEFISRSTKTVGENDYRCAIVIEINGNRSLSFYDGEPEDNCISRNFNDVYSIPKMLEEAFKAGLRGETLEILNTTSDEI